MSENKKAENWWNSISQERQNRIKIALPRIVSMKKSNRSYDYIAKNSEVEKCKLTVDELKSLVKTVAYLAVMCSMAQRKRPRERERPKKKKMEDDNETMEDMLNDLEDEEMADEDEKEEAVVTPAKKPRRSEYRISHENDSPNSPEIRYRTETIYVRNDTYIPLAWLTMQTFQKKALIVAFGAAKSVVDNVVTEGCLWKLNPTEKTLNMDVAPLRVENLQAALLSNALRDSGLTMDALKYTGGVKHELISQEFQLKELGFPEKYKIVPESLKCVKGCGMTLFTFDYLDEEKPILATFMIPTATFGEPEAQPQNQNQQQQ